MKDLLVHRAQSYPVKEFFENHRQDLQLTLKTPTFALDTEITEVSLHRPGMALSGFTDVFSSQRVQIMGITEWSFLNSISSKGKMEIVARLEKFRSPLWIFTHDHPIPKELLDLCTNQGVPIMCTPFPTMEFCTSLQVILDNWFSPSCSLHGTLVDVYGVGLLYVGKSGVGKSECALDLVERGHRLVADDVVTLIHSGNSIIGKGNKTLGHHMEIRGVGIVDVGLLFGIRAIRDKKKVEVIVELRHWKDGERYDRTGLDEYAEDVMGVPIPLKVIPITPGKNITVISEVIAMNMLLKMNGIDVVRRFNENLIAKIRTKSGAKIFPVSTSDFQE